MDSGVFYDTVGTPRRRFMGRAGTGSRIHSRAAAMSNPPMRGVFGCLIPARTLWLVGEFEFRENRGSNLLATNGTINDGAWRREGSGFELSLLAAVSTQV